MANLFRSAFLTNELIAKGADATEVVGYAVRAGFDALELGPTFPVDGNSMELIHRNNLAVAGLIYCRNMLADDVETAERHHNEVRRRIDLASQWGVPLVTVSGGIENFRGAKERYDGYEAIRALPGSSIDGFVTVFAPLLDLAEKQGIRLALENCPLMGNFAISPEIWGTIFSRLDSPRLGLTFDPSHLVWELIDPYLALEDWHERVFHFHAKDTEIKQDVLRRTGILTDFSWWRYRIPGWGELDWRRLLTILLEFGYTGFVSVEHEDPVFTGSVERVEQALTLALRHLQEALPATLPET